ncbi:MAG: nuclear transport factor 2 family protein, partial [Hyphomicrobiales bacterium]
RHDMARMGPMFAHDMVYASSGVGSHRGADAIRAMMAGFHDANPDVHWRAEHYRLTGEDGVEFDFVMTMGGQEHPGVERIFFDPAGLIRRIEVER